MAISKVADTRFKTLNPPEEQIHEIPSRGVIRVIFTRVVLSL